MTDRTKQMAFKLAASRFEGALFAAARLGMRDAQAIRWRAQGGANLQGHANALVPVAILLAQLHPSVLKKVRIATNFLNSMGKGTPESRDPALRAIIEHAIRTLRKTNGPDVFAHELRSRKQITIDKACDTYLSAKLGGGQANGGAGDTVIKRALKIIAHF